MGVKSPDDFGEEWLGTKPLSHVPRRIPVTFKLIHVGLGLKRRLMKVTFLVMTLNEIEGMRVIMPQIPKGVFDQILICDGGSTNGTIDWSRENGYEVYVQSRPRHFLGTTSLS